MILSISFVASKVASTDQKHFFHFFFFFLMVEKLESYFSVHPCSLFVSAIQKNFSRIPIDHIDLLSMAFKCLRLNKLAEYKFDID